MITKFINFFRNLFSRRTKELKEEVVLITPTVPVEAKPKRQRKPKTAGTNIKAAKKRVARKKKD